MIPVSRSAPSVMPTEPNGDADAAEAFLGHDQNGLGHRRFRRDERELLAAVHDVLDPDQDLAEIAARVKGVEVVGREALGVWKCRPRTVPVAAETEWLSWTNFRSGPGTPNAFML